MPDSRDEGRAEWAMARAPAVNDCQESNFSKMWGPVIARQLAISNNTQNHYVPFGTLLPGMPATYEEVTILSVVPGSYGE